MAINWNQAEYVSPKVQITPEQLPIEAGVKVGTVLQDRYDKSYENYTKAGEALRQMLNDAHDIDKPAVKQIYDEYQNKLKDISESGDFHNMRWQTLNLATEAADNYRSIAERNKAIQAQEELISKDPRWSLKREEALADFRKGLSSVSYNPETRSFSGLNVSPYNAAADVDKNKFYSSYGKLIEPIVTSIKNREVIPMGENGEELPTSQAANAPYFITRTTQGGKKVITHDMLFGRLKGIALADDNIKAEMERDARREGITTDEVFRKYHIPSIEAVSNLLKQSQTQSQDMDQIVPNKNYIPGSLNISSEITNMIPSEGKVTVNKDIDDKLTKISKMEFDEDGNYKPSVFQEATNHISQVYHNVKDKDNLGDVLKMEPLKTQSLMEINIPKPFLSTLKKQGLTDREITRTYEHWLRNQKKIINAGYTFIDPKDQSVAVQAISAASKDVGYIDENGKEISKIEDLKDADVKFYPSAGQYAIVKDGKQYFPRVVIPSIESQMDFSKELVHDFTDITSTTNIVHEPNSGKSIIITKDKFHPDGNYEGTISVVKAIQNPDGSLAYVREGERIPYNTRKNHPGTLPEAIHSHVREALKSATNTVITE